MDLTSVLTPDVMAPILANPEVQQRLMPYLPSGESLPQSSEELSNTLSSPQFQQVHGSLKASLPFMAESVAYLYQHSAEHTTLLKLVSPAVEVECKISVFWLELSLRVCVLTFDLCPGFCRQ